jgi:nucleotide-binding universal stress UspA family protein
MEKKILLAVDDSIHSRRTLDYAARMRSIIPQLTVTLFHVQPCISQFLLEEAKRSLPAQAELKKLIFKNGEAAQELLSRYKDTLVRAGMPQEAVQMATSPRHLGLAKDILDYAQHSLFDAVLVGRRGISGLQQMVMGSVTSSLIENSRVIPIWLVDGEVRSARFMAAVDGSESALRAVDHLAFMLSGPCAAKVHFFHVTPKLRDYCEIDFNQTQSAELERIIVKGDKRCMDDFFPAALKKLHDAGIHEEQIEYQTVSSLVNVGEAIVKAAREGDVGTLVIGRRGLNTSFFSGSVSGYLSQKLTHAALWVVP